MEGKNTEGGTQEEGIGTEKVNVEGKNTEGGTQEKE